MISNGNPVAETEAMLIAESINILGIRELKGNGWDGWAVLYEFPYTAGSVPKRWTKQVYFTQPMSEEKLYKQLRDWVIELREILEN